MAIFISNSVEETIAAGRTYGQSAAKGEVFALIGDLGAGKTQFVKGVVAGLESSAEVTSPTFVLVHEYEGGRLPVYHFDFYRLDNSESVMRLGFDDYIFGDGVSLIEWADRYPDLIPKGAKWLSFELKGEYTRVIDEGNTMKVLALELSCRQGSIAWLEKGAELFVRTFANDRKHSGLFFENLQRCSREFGAPDVIVVGIGPGSYAGVRIAIATALGLRAASVAKLAGIPSICAIEVAAREYCVIGDARRESFFFGRVRDGKLTEGPSLYSSDELETKISESSLPLYASEPLPQFSKAVLTYPSARRLAELAHEQVEEIADTRSLEPIYLREPHITVPKASPTTAMNR